MTFVLLGALAIGLALGLLGSGGSILTVPVLVFLLGQEEKVGIAGSLFIVGVIAAAGAVQFGLGGMVHWRSVLYFGLPGMMGTYGGAWLGGHASGSTQLTVFAAVVLLAAFFMLRPLSPQAAPVARRVVWKVALDGLGVGVLTGFVGVGGGFLIVPALVLLGGVLMHRAVGTSLVIIALKSFTGFFKYLQVLEDLDLHLDWQVLGIVSGIGIVGGLLGRTLGQRLPREQLQRLFAIFLVAVGLSILGRTVSPMDRVSEGASTLESDRPILRELEKR